MEQTSEKKWFAIRVTYNRELKVKVELEAKGIECFVPMSYKEVLLGGRKVRKLMPSIHNLIFVNMTEEEMKRYKQATTLPIRYIMDAATKHPLIVPDVQMRNFIAVSSTNDEQLVYLNPDELNLKKGDCVRVVGGLFEGCEGVFMRLKGDRRVVISIPGVVAVATAFIHPSLIQKLE
ncbi:MAG: UpxY family transcription antiterminator [Bacteroidetes bacterium]|uniref:UpxY family transcription antiterminator n=1 Tax=Candidatus Limisoma faecipullorum TaxID=2840854 RepID=A0A9D9NKK1_9BACT|nr:UpxY family transcription antiterminator [Candidatus Limisoma faecipullorum]